MKTIDKNIDISNLYLTSLPDWMGEIDIVNGYFDCSNNLLTSLKGCPKEVKGSFDCSSNNLTSLEGSPEIVDGYFDCSENNLTSLKGCPEKVDGSFFCYGNLGKFTKEDVRKVCKVKGKIYC